MDIRLDIITIEKYYLCIGWSTFFKINIQTTKSSIQNEKRKTVYAQQSFK